MIERKDVMPVNFLKKENFTGSDTGMRPFGIGQLLDPARNHHPLARSFPFGAELEDTLDDTLCLLVGYESLAVIVPLAVAVGRLAA